MEILILILIKLFFIKNQVILIRNMIEIIYIAIYLDYLSVEEFTDWINLKISNNENESYFIDFIYNKERKKWDVIELLKNYVSDDFTKASEYFFSQFYNLIHSGYYDWEEVENELVKFYENDFVEKNIFFVRLKDDFLLRKDGFSGNMDMPKELMFFLEKHKLCNTYIDLTIW